MLSDVCWAWGDEQFECAVTLEKPVHSGSMHDDASPSLVELDAAFSEADIMIWSICNSATCILPALSVTDIAIEVWTVTVTVC